MWARTPASATCLRALHAQPRQRGGRAPGGPLGPAPGRLRRRSGRRGSRPMSPLLMPATSSSSISRLRCGSHSRTPLQVGPQAAVGAIQGPGCRLLSWSLHKGGWKTRSTSCRAVPPRSKERSPRSCRVGTSVLRAPPSPPRVAPALAPLGLRNRRIGAPRRAWRADPWAALASLGRAMHPLKGWCRPTEKQLVLMLHSWPTKQPRLSLLVYASAVGSLPCVFLCLPRLHAQHVFLLYERLCRAFYGWHCLL
mmetsp:Transcript_140135/g.447190  ORF Transcript_140135/g.447190 Transcript_140135/m.447190 type:complete len:252 (+) Transcript_140135:235-990(+)